MSGFSQGAKSIMKTSRWFMRVAVGVALLTTMTVQAQDTFEQASASAAIAGHALSKVHRWLLEVALP